MSGKKIVLAGLFLGSLVGGFVPMLWGDTSVFSFSSILLSAVGGIVGIFAAYKVAQSTDLF